MLHLRCKFNTISVIKKQPFFLKKNVCKGFEMDNNREQKCWNLELKLFKRIYYNGKTNCLGDGNSKNIVHSAF